MNGTAPLSGGWAPQRKRLCPEWTAGLHPRIRYRIVSLLPGAPVASSGSCSCRDSHPTRRAQTCARRIFAKLRDSNGFGVSGNRGLERPGCEDTGRTERSTPLHARSLGRVDGQAETLRRGSVATTASLAEAHSRGAWKLPASEGSGPHLGSDRQITHSLHVFPYAHCSSVGTPYWATNRGLLALIRKDGCLLQKKTNSSSQVAENCLQIAPLPSRPASCADHPFVARCDCRVPDASADARPSQGVDSRRGRIGATMAAVRVGTASCAWPLRARRGASAAAAVRTKPTTGASPSAVRESPRAFAQPDLASLQHRVISIPP